MRQCIVNSYLLAAGILAIILGVVHSILGEWLVFRRLRVKSSLSWSTDLHKLPLGSIRILWASWHLVTIFGWGFGVILFQLSDGLMDDSISGFAANTIAISMFASAMLVLIGTKGKHPGWLVLLCIGLLTWMG